MLKRLAQRYVRCAGGAVAVEYVLIAAAMFTALIPAFLYVASGIEARLSSVTGFFGGS